MCASATATASAPPPRRVASLARQRPIILALGLALGQLAACFSPPSDPVLFSCEAEADDRCPPDYRCEADNCCHRLGSDIQANFGACALSGNSGGPGETSGDTDTDTDSGTETDTGTETGTDTETG